jgi:hypothetical protein
MVLNKNLFQERIRIFQREYADFFCLKANRMLMRLDNSNISRKIARFLMCFFLHL